MRYPKHLKARGGHVHDLSVLAKQHIGCCLVHSGLLYLEGCHELPPREERREVLDLEPDREDVAGGVLAEDKALSAGDLISRLLDTHCEELIVMI